MHLLDLTLPTPEENLALDEALLEEAEERHGGEVLRLWEPRQRLAVIGRSSQAAREVDVEACRRLGIPVLRRSSGGCAIVTGPGCLMYAVVLSLEARPQLQAIDEAHRFVLGCIAAALSRQLPGVGRRGTSDLALDDRKFSGNSMRVKRRHLLYHGTLLYDFPLSLVSQVLPMPPRQPEYRHSRGHDSFLANLPLSAAALRQALIAAFDAHEPLSRWPRERTAQLAAEKYLQPEWNLRL